MDTQTDTNNPDEQTTQPAPAEVIDDAPWTGTVAADGVGAADGVMPKEGMNGKEEAEGAEHAQGAQNAEGMLAAHPLAEPPGAVVQPSAPEAGAGGTFSGPVPDGDSTAAPPDAPAAPRAGSEEGAPPAAPAEVVPLARLQGVQRILAQTQKDLTAARAEAAALRDTLSATEKRAAGEYAERLRATERNIVPQIIRGETIEQVDQSLANSKAAFSAAQQAYARQLPTPALARVGPAALPDADQTLTPLQLLRAGLAKTNDINQ